MRLSKPRIEPVKDSELSEEQAEIVQSLNEAAQNLNLFRTTLHSVETMKPMLAWSNYVGSKKLNDIPWREKELIILRTSFKSVSGYEWSHHAYLGKHAGLNDDEIAALRDGNEGYQWGDLDQALIAMCDELVADSFVTDETWSVLAKHLSQKQLMDAVYTSAHYQMVAKFANTFGIQKDDGVPLHEDLYQLVEGYF